MANPIFKAPEEQHEIDPRMLRRDTKPILQNFVEIILTPEGAMGVSIGMIILSFLFPEATFLSLLMTVLLWGTTAAYKNAQKEKLGRLPLRLPKDAGDLLDYGNPLPGRKGYRKGEGVSFLGTSIGGDWSMNKEVWASFSDLLTHMLVLGGTGAGKTETMVSMSFNDVALGGGLGYIDAKAAPKLYGQLWNIARICGRDDDMRALNFALGQEKIGKTRFWRSNTMQPFAIGKAEALKEIPLSLMASGGSSGGSIFESNAKALITALMMALVEMRDKGEIYLYPGDIVHYMQPMEFAALAKRKDFTQTTQDAIINFLKSMGWKPDIDDSSKWGDFDRQYSYAQNYFLDTFSTMNNTYRHIFAARVGDINMVDVILQRRIFVALIPSLEKSKKELENIGKITLSVTRLATAVGLGGGEIMGSWRKLIDLGISNARVPFFLKIDEVAAILVEGLAEMFTQGRGLGMSCTVGSQDWAGIEGASEVAKKEAQQMLSNTKLKFFMTGDDPMKTKELIEKLADETDEFRTQGFAVNGMINYYDTLSASAQRVKRVNSMDIAQQIEGEWHLFFKGKIVRGRGFHAGAMPKDPETPLFVHHFLQVLRPAESELSARFGTLKSTLESWIAKANDERISLDGTKAEFTNPAPEGLIRVINNPGRLAYLRREMAAAAIYEWMIAQPVSIQETEGDTITSNAEPEDELEAEHREVEKALAQSAMIIPGAESLRAAVNSIVTPDESDVYDESDDYIPNDDDEYSDSDAIDEKEEVEVRSLISQVITEPAYPLPPKPEPVTPERFRADTLTWLTALKGGKNN